MVTCFVCIILNLSIESGLQVEASVVQWLSHSPCKPGVAGSIPGFSKNNQQKSTSWLSLRELWNNKPTKTTYYNSTGLARGKKKKTASNFLIVKAF